MHVTCFKVLLLHRDLLLLLLKDWRRKEVGTNQSGTTKLALKKNTNAFLQHNYASRLYASLALLSKDGTTKPFPCGTMSSV
jgi:hypothetical protein